MWVNLCVGTFVLIQMPGRRCSSFSLSPEHLPALSSRHCGSINNSWLLQQKEKCGLAGFNRHWLKVLCANLSLVWALDAVLYQNHLFFWAEIIILFYCIVLYLFFCTICSFLNLTGYCVPFQLLMNFLVQPRFNSIKQHKSSKYCFETLMTIKEAQSICKTFISIRLTTLQRFYTIGKWSKCAQCYASTVIHQQWI